MNDARKRRVGKEVFHLDYDIWVKCKNLGLTEQDIRREQEKLLLYGIKTTATLAAAVAIKEYMERNHK